MKKISKRILISSVIFGVILVVLTISKYMNFDLYKGKVKVSKVTVETKGANRKLLTKSTNNLDGTQVNTVPSFSTLKYKINYSLKSDRNVYRTANIKVKISDDDKRYVVLKTLKADNISSSLSDDGKELLIKVKNVETNKDYSIEIEVNINNAPSEYKFSPIVEVSDSANEEETKQVRANVVEVKTTSIEGVVKNKSTNVFAVNAKVSICKIDGENCINEKITYTDTEGKYVISDLEEGTYKVHTEEGYEVENPEIIIGTGKNVVNLIFEEKGKFNASIKKYLEAIKVGEKEYEIEKSQKVVLPIKGNKKEYVKTTYVFEIENVSEIAGNINIIKESIPEGFKLSEDYEENQNWKEESGDYYNKSLSKITLKPNDIKEVRIQIESINPIEAKEYINKVEIKGESYHRVKYVVGEEVVRDIEVADADKIDDLKYEKTNYEFKGWYIDRSFSEKYNFDNVVEDDLILFGKLEEEIRMCHFTYYDDDEETVLRTSDIVCGNVEVEKKLTEEEIPEGYNFGCWLISDKTSCYNFEEQVNEDTDVIASYTIQQLNVTFIDQGISYKNGEFDHNVNYNAKATKPSEDPEMEGYTFLGWTLDGADYDFENTPVTRSITLVSKYNINKYSILFIDEKKEENPNTPYHVINDVEVGTNLSTIEKPVDPEHYGYDFVGWYEKENGEFKETEFNFNSSMPDNNVTLYAKYTKETYPVTYKDPENEDTIYKTDNVEYEETTTPPEENPTKTCKEFKYWSLYKTGFNGGLEARFNFDTRITEETVLYAIFETSDMTVTYVDKGHVVSTQTVACGSKVTPSDICEDSAENCNKPGYEFECFRDSKNISECVDEPTINTSTTLVTSYIKLPGPAILHTPTNWINTNVTVTINYPTTAKKVISKSKVTNTNGLITYSEEETETNEDLTLTNEKYDIKYQYTPVGGNSSELTTYSNPFEEETNGEVTAKVVNKETSEYSEEISHSVRNIDKINPSMGAITQNSTINTITIGTNGLDAASGIDKMKTYIIKVGDYEEVEDCTFTSEKINDGDRGDKGPTTSLPYSCEIDGLDENTTYKVKVEFTDVAGNKTESDEMDISTEAGEPTRIVARVIRENGTDLDEANYRNFPSLNAALNYCTNTITSCTIQMVEDTEETNTILASQDIILDLNGKTVSGAGITTITNNGNLQVVDHNNTTDITGQISSYEPIGKIINEKENGIAILNNGSLIIGENEVDDDSDGSVIIDAEPYIKGSSIGIQSNEGTTFKFYDGTIIGNYSSIVGTVTTTPIPYKVNTLDSTDKISNLEIIDSAVARVKRTNTYYTSLDAAKAETNIGEYVAGEPVEYTELKSLLTQSSKTQYGIEKDDTTEEYINNNKKISNSLALSAMRIDLTNYDNDQMLVVNASIDSYYNSYRKLANTGFAVVKEESEGYDINTIPSDSDDRFIDIYGKIDAKDYKAFLPKGKVYYLYLGFSETSISDANYSDTITINSIKLENVDGEVVVPTKMPDGSGTDYPFIYDSSTNSFKNAILPTYSDKSHSYYVIDTTGFTENKVIKVSIEVTDDYKSGCGNVSLTTDANVPSIGNTRESIVYSCSGNITKEGEKILYPGNIYYLHFVKSLGYSFESQSSFYVKEISIDGEYLFKPFSGPYSSSSLLYSQQVPSLNEEPDTIQLLKNIYLGADDNPFTVSEIRDVILDLNGHILSRESNNYIIENAGGLKIIDSKGKVGKLYGNNNYDVIKNYNNANLTVSNAIISLEKAQSSSSNHSVIDNYGIVNLDNDAEIWSKASGTVGITNNTTGKINSISGTIKVNGGIGIVNSSLNDLNNINISITSGNGVHLNQNGEININNLNVYSENSEETASGRAIINGSSSTANVENLNVNSIGYAIQNDGIANLNNSTTRKSNIYQGVNNAKTKLTNIDFKEGIITNFYDNLIELESGTVEGSLNIYGNFNMTGGKIISDNNNNITLHTGYQVNNTVNITGGEILSISTDGVGMTQYKSDGVFNIEGNNYRALTLNIGGNFKLDNDSTGAAFYIKGFDNTSDKVNINIYGNSTFDAKLKYGFYFTTSPSKSDNNVTIKDNAVIKFSENFVYNIADKYTFNIGEKDGIVNTDYPKLISENSVLDNIANSKTEFYKFNFYDGALIGKKDEIIKGFFNDVESGYDIKIEDESETLQKVTLSKEELAQNHENAIARIDDNYFMSIQDAIDSINSNEQKTVVLLKDLNTVASFSIPSEKNVIIDINGKNINYYTSLNYITNEGQLKLTDNTRTVIEHGALSIENKIVNYANNFIMNNGTLNVEKIQVNSFFGSIINNVDNGSFEIESGNYICDYKFNKLCNVIDSTSSSDSIISGGLIKADISKETAISYKNSKLTINEGNISARVVINMESGDLIINDGKLYNDDNRRDPAIITKNINFIMNGGESGCIRIDNVDDSYTVKMTGGTIISSYNGLSVNNSVVEMQGGTINTTGTGISNNNKIIIGTKGDLDSNNNIIMNKDNPSITGTNGINVDGEIYWYDGTIKSTTSTPITGTLAEIEDGYTELEEREGGYYIKYLGKIPIAKLESTGEEYYDLKSAVAAASTDSQETIILLGSWNQRNTLEIPSDKNIIIDLQRNIINCYSNDCIVNKGILRIIDTVKPDGYALDDGKITGYSTNSGDVLYPIHNENDLSFGARVYVEANILNETATDKTITLDNGIIRAIKNKSGKVILSDNVNLNGSGDILVNESSGKIEIKTAKMNYNGRFVNDGEFIIDTDDEIVSALSITNNGTFKIISGGFSSTRSGYYITNNQKAIFINKGEIKCNVNNYGTFYLLDGKTSDFKENKGTLYLLNGESGSVRYETSGAHQYEPDGPVYIGRKIKPNDVSSYEDENGIKIYDDGVDTDSIKTGAIYTRGDINFYDGTVKGYGFYPTDVEEGYRLKLEITSDAYINTLTQTKPIQVIPSNSSLTNSEYYKLSEIPNNLQNGDTIKFIDNYVTSGTTDIYEISDGKEINIDLNGNKIFYKGSSNIINNLGTLRINDSSENKNNLIKNTENEYFNIIISTGNLEINNINIESTVKTSGSFSMASGNINYLDNYGTATLDDTSKFYRFRNYGSLTINNSEMTNFYNFGSSIINNAKIIFTFNNSENGGITINNGNFGSDVKLDDFYSRAESAVENKSGTINIYGGTFTYPCDTIKNFGTLIIDGVNSSSVDIETTDSKYSAITEYIDLSNGYSKTASTTISNAKIHSNYTLGTKQAYLIYGYNVTLNSGAKVQSDGYGVSAVTGTINENVDISAEKIALNGGTIIVKENVNITSNNQAINATNITLGTKDGIVNVNSPNIYGKEVGVTATTINFYDGKITSKETKVIGTATDIETGYTYNSVINSENNEETITLKLAGGVTEYITIGEGANKQNYTSLQSAINSVLAGNTETLTLHQNVILDSNITVPDNTTIIIDLNGCTLDKNGFSFVGNNIVVKTTDNVDLLATIRSLLSVSTNLNKNVVVFNDDNGKLLNSGEEYTLKIKTYKGYEDLDMTKDGIDTYKVAIKATDEKINTIRGSVMLKNMSEGEYILQGSKGTKATFVINADGTLSGNVRNTYLPGSSSRTLGASSTSLIVGIQTGQKVIRYSLLIMSIGSIISLLLIIKKKASK